MPQKKFTLYWKTGDREVVEGSSAGQAMTLAGYSRGATRALDFWDEGECHDYVWNKETRKWDATPESPLGRAVAAIQKTKAS